MLALTEARAAAAAVLENPDWPVQYGVPDAVSPPTLIVAWAPTWLRQKTGCHFEASAQVICVAGRITPGAGLDLLDEMVSFVVGRLLAQRWPLVPGTPGPISIEIAGLAYLANRVPFVIPVAIPAEVLAHA